MAGTGQRTDSFAEFNFILDIDGLYGTHGFSECSGSNIEQDVIGYRAATMDTAVIKVLRKAGDITLKRGITTNHDLRDWQRAVLKGNVVRRDGHLTLNDAAGKPALRWKFTAAWPRTYTAPSSNATGDDVAIEKLVLAVEGFEIEQ